MVVERSPIRTVTGPARRRCSRRPSAPATYALPMYSSSSSSQPPPVAEPAASSLCRLIEMLIVAAAELSAGVGQDAQQRHLRLLEERQHTVVEQVGRHDSRSSPCRASPRPTSSRVRRRNNVCSALPGPRPEKCGVRACGVRCSLAPGRTPAARTQGRRWPPRSPAPSDSTGSACAGTSRLTPQRRPRRPLPIAVERLPRGRARRLGGSPPPRPRRSGSPA